MASMSKNCDLALSVVIPTLGGESLGTTIAQLNRGTLVPREILVCIPEKEAPRVQNLGLPGVGIIMTDVRGQVAQRAKGFQEGVSARPLYSGKKTELPIDPLIQLRKWEKVESTAIQALLVFRKDLKTITIKPSKNLVLRKDEQNSIS